MGFLCSEVHMKNFKFSDHILQWIICNLRKHRTLKLISKIGSLLRKSGNGAIRKRTPNGKWTAKLCSTPELTWNWPFYWWNLQIIGNNLQLYPYRLTAVGVRVNKVALSTYSFTNLQCTIITLFPLDEGTSTLMSIVVF